MSAPPGDPKRRRPVTLEKRRPTSKPKTDTDHGDESGDVKSKYQRRWRGISPNAEKPYAWFSIEAANRCLEVSDKAGLAVYVALCSMEAKTSERFKTSFFASRAEIARASGVSKNYLTRIIRTLEQAKLIRVKRPTGKAKIDHEANQFTILSRVSRGTKEGLPKEQKRDSRRTTDNEENRDTIKNILCGSREDIKEIGRSANLPSANAGQDAAAEGDGDFWEGVE